MWIVWPFSKKNFGSTWNVYSDFKMFIEPKMGSFAIRDEKKLPHPKKIIFDSICILLVTETQKHTSENMQLLAFELAFFQKDVGDTPLYPLGIDFDTFGSDEDVTSADVTRFYSANPAAKETYDRFNRLRDADWTRMKAIMAKLPRKTSAM